MDVSDTDKSIGGGVWLMEASYPANLIKLVALGPLTFLQGWKQCVVTHLSGLAQIKAVQCNLIEQNRRT